MHRQFAPTLFAIPENDVATPAPALSRTYSSSRYSVSTSSTTSSEEEDDNAPSPSRAISGPSLTASPPRNSTAHRGDATSRVRGRTGHDIRSASRAVPSPAIRTASLLRRRRIAREDATASLRRCTRDEACSATEHLPGIAPAIPAVVPSSQHGADPDCKPSTINALIASLGSAFPPSPHRPRSSSIPLYRGAFPTEQDVAAAQARYYNSAAYRAAMARWGEERRRAREEKGKRDCRRERVESFRIGEWKRGLERQGGGERGVGWVLRKGRRVRRWIWEGFVRTAGG